MSRRFTSVLVLFACFAAGLLVAGRIRETTEAGAQSATPSRPPVTAPGPVANGGALPDFSRVAERTDGLGDEAGDDWIDRGDAR